MKSISRELNYMYREFGTPKIELFYLDYTHVVRDMYNDIIGGTVYVRKTTDLLGTIKTDPELLAQVYNNLPIMDVKQKALFKVSTKELYDSGILDVEGNWTTKDDKTTGVLEGFLNMFIRYKGEFYGIIQLQPALIYRGEIGSIYITTSKTYKISDYAGKAKVVIGDPVVNRGEVIEVKSANSSEEFNWIDITVFNASSMTPLTPTKIYIKDIASIPNLSTSSVLVINDLVYNILDYAKTTEKDYEFNLEVNNTLVASDIVTKEPEAPVDPVDPPVEEGELSRITLDEPLYSNSRVATFYDIYSEGRWSYDSSVIGATSVGHTLAISEIPTDYKDNEDTILSVYSSEGNLFDLPLEVLINSTEKTITETVIVVKDIPYVVIGKTLVEDMYRYELATTKYGVIGTVPLPPVPDTTPPVITMENVSVDVQYKSKGYNDSALLKLLKVTVTDDSGEDLEATIEGTYDPLVKGIYPLKVVAVDSSGNRAEKDITVEVKDMSPPVITGTNAEIEIDSPTLSEEEIKTLLGIEVTDEDEFTVEVIGSLDTSLEGIQTITIKATDVSGNIASKDFTITVTVPVAEYGREWEHIATTVFHLRVSSMYIRKLSTFNVGIVGTLPEESLSHVAPPSDLLLYAEESDLLLAEIIDSNGNQAIVSPNNSTGVANKQCIVSFKLGDTSRQEEFGIDEVTKVEGTTKYKIKLAVVNNAFLRGGNYDSSALQKATKGMWV